MRFLEGLEYSLKVPEYVYWVHCCLISCQETSDQWSIGLKVFLAAPHSSIQEAFQVTDL